MSSVAAEAADSPIEPVIVGRVAGVFGTRGWLRVISHTRPRENLTTYNPWHLRCGSRWRRFSVIAARWQANGLLVHLAGLDDRGQAMELVRADIAVERACLPALAPGEYYWRDLVGLRVVNPEGQELGKVANLLETGTNDVLEIAGERQRLIPFVLGHYVLAVDLDRGEMTVDWHVDD